MNLRKTLLEHSVCSDFRLWVLFRTSVASSWKGKGLSRDSLGRQEIPFVSFVCHFIGFRCVCTQFLARAPKSECLAYAQALRWGLNHRENGTGRLVHESHSRLIYWQKSENSFLLNQRRPNDERSDVHGLTLWLT